MTRFFIFLFLSLPFNAFCQLDNSVFYDRMEIKAENKNDLMLSISTLGFTKDNEYFNPVAEGYTLFGYQLNPELVYFPSENVRIEAGVFVLKDFGNSKYSQIAPTYSLKIKKDSLSFTLGTIQGSLTHNLIEPLYNFEKVLNNRLEDGFQVRLNKKRIFMDVWLNWERMQYNLSPFQEELWGGVSSSFKLKKDENWDVSIPLQLIAKHKGGQLDINPAPLTTLFNGATGLSAHYQNNSPGFFRGIKTDNYIVNYKDFSFKYTLPYQNGFGVYLNFTMLTKLSDVMLSYWHGEDFYAFRGGYLYSSVSSKPTKPGYLAPQRNLLILRFLKDYRITDGLFLSTRFEPFYDFQNKKINFSMGLYLNYKAEFLLKKIKKQ